jgi:hypothetical protein
MAKLSITDLQKTSILDAVDSALQDAFAEGTKGTPSNVTHLPEMYGYASILTADQQLAVKVAFKQVIAALIKTLEIDPVNTHTIPVGKVTPGGSPGYIAIRNGIVVAYSDPT